MHGSKEVDELKTLLIEKFDVKSVRFPDTVSLGIKPVSKEGSERLIRSAIQCAMDHKKTFGYFST